MKSSTSALSAVSLLLLLERRTEKAERGSSGAVLRTVIQSDRELETCHHYLPWCHSAALQSKSAPILPLVTAQPQYTFPNDRKKYGNYMFEIRMNKRSRSGMTAPGLDSPLCTQVFASVDFKGDSSDLHRHRYKPMNLQFPKGQTKWSRNPPCKQLSIPIKSCLQRKHISC